jgi:hypothetical protein
MRSEVGFEPKLTVAAVERRLTSELRSLGFVRVKWSCLKLVKAVNADTEVFLYPSAIRVGTEVLIDPFIGVDNVTLRARLLAVDRERWEGLCIVCHAVLAVLASWDRLFVHTNAGLDRAAAQVVRSAIEVGLPIMREFDTLEKVKRLFRDELAGSKKARVAVVFAEEKLAQIERH